MERIERKQRTDGQIDGQRDGQQPPSFNRDVRQCRHIFSPSLRNLKAIRSKETNSEILVLLSHRT